MKVVAATWQRVEALALFGAALAAYAHMDASWILFAVLFLAPDVSFAADLAGPSLGALGYNLAHSLIGPLVLGAVGLAASIPSATSVALIWLAHIGLDRALGYGLKSPEAFGVTHLGLIGRARSRP
ncbi:DUF4260 domain-containing protein [Brevundimonas sp.]|uniref:DUF4260 domain-containing protein n=1 Tax=Brevundimonas sp. TaxID=1871086 RepID=UPI00257FB8D1|nr:DUF4260 domain-containing protein [Brevundimonas sp.]